MVQFQKNRDIRRAREETSEDRRLNSDDNLSADELSEKQDFQDYSCTQSYSVSTLWNLILNFVRIKLQTMKTRPHMKETSNKF